MKKIKKKQIPTGDPYLLLPSAVFSKLKEVGYQYTVLSFQNC